MDWTEKYRPQTLDDVVGNPGAVNSLRMWADSWQKGIPEMRAVVLIGTPGLGKTTSAEALAKDMGWDIIEMNASDQRNAEAIENIAVLGSKFKTFSEDGTFQDTSRGMKTLILLDEADNFFGNADRGAIPVITKLIRETRQPLILIVNDFYGLTRKCSAAKTDTLQIKFSKAKTVTMVKALGKIAENEGVDVDADALNIIAEKANGDMRAAVRNLESLCLGQNHVTAEMASELSERDRRSDMFALMAAIFRSSDPMSARKLMREIESDPQEVELWVDENIPYEFPDTGDMVRGFEKLSRADIFLGRVHRRQYYGFWSYASDLMTAGVGSARMSNKHSHDYIRNAAYLSKMSRSKTVRALRKSVVLKLAVYLHTSSKRVDLDILQYVKYLAINDEDLRLKITKELELEPEELGFLIDKKPDSKDVKAVFLKLEAPEAEEAPVKKAKAAPKKTKEVAPLVPEPEPVKEKAKPVEESKPKNQASLFDF